MIRFINFLFCISIGMIASAKQITEQQALQIALKYAQGIEQKGNVGTQRMKAAKRASGVAAYYAFNVGDDEGFVIVSGDDSLTELVGYSDKGRFDYDRMPDNMRSWLRMYSDYVASVQASASVAKSESIDDVTTVVVRPFVATRWNQGEPYDRLVPMLNSDNHCATGCVATAMAQIMKYYEWPERGTGSNSYECEPYGTLSMDFSQSVYDWDNMLDIYSSYYDNNMQMVPEYSDEQAEAVAKLMYDCGISVNMTYGSTSGAFDPAIPNAFNNYFKYNSKIYYRNNMSSSEFMKLLLSELDAKRPVLICGQGLGGGHAFVADGYDSNSFVHINWGWGGYSDGYFNVNYLDPEGLGTGGGSGAFQWSQSMTIAYPNYTGETPEREQLMLGYTDTDTYTGGVSMSVSEFSQTQQQDVTLTNIYNQSGSDYYGVVSVAAVDSEGLITVIGLMSYAVNGLPSRYLYTEPWSITSDFSVLADGEYDICGVSKENSDEYEYDWIKFNSKLCVRVRVENGVVTVIPHEYDLSLVKQIEKPENIYMNADAGFTTTIRNNSSLTADGVINYEIRKVSDGSLVDTNSIQAIIYDYNEYAANLVVTVSVDTYENGEEYVISVTGFTLNSGETIPVKNEFGECVFTVDEGSAQRRLSFYDNGTTESVGISLNVDSFSKNEFQDVVFTNLLNSYSTEWSGGVNTALCDSNDEILAESPYPSYFTFKARTYYQHLSLVTPDLSGVPDGFYSIIPLTMEDGASEWVRFDHPSKIDIEVKGDYVYVINYEYSISQESEITAEGELTSGGLGVFNVQMRNNSEEDAIGDLFYEIRKQSDNSFVCEGSVRISLPAYSTNNVAIGQMLSEDMFAEGVYTIAITDYMSVTHADFSFATDYSPSAFAVGASGAEVIGAGEVRVYPNPAEDYVTVECGEPVMSVAIYSASGQLVKSVGGVDATNNIYVGDLHAGYYVMTVETESGTIVRNRILKR